MKTATRLILSAFLAVSAAAAAAEIHASQPAGLTVHEWGTFTSVAGENGSAVVWDALGCASDLPHFVNDYGYRGFKFRLQGTVRMETPVLYFYSSHELDANVKVSFPHGLITEWYPNATYKIDKKTAFDASSKPVTVGDVELYNDPSLRNLTGNIEWRNIKIQPAGAASPDLPVEGAKSRYYAARGTDASLITIGNQHEKFLFYRGVGTFPIPLAARLSDGGRVIVENRGHEPVPSVILFENHDGIMGYRTAAAHLSENGLTFDTPIPGASFEQLRQDLEATLVAQGLFAKEAHAMLETWQDSWFEEGSRLIYIVPQAAVDSVLPLQMEPAPQTTVRVYVGRIELVTPETRRSVESAAARSDWAALERYSRFLEPTLSRIFGGDPGRLSQVETGYRNYRQSHRTAGCR